MKPKIIIRIRGISFATVKIVCAAPPTLAPMQFSATMMMIHTIATGTTMPSPRNSFAWFATATANAATRPG